MPVVPFPKLDDRHGLLLNNPRGYADTDDPLSEARRQLQLAIDVETDWAGQYTRIRLAQVLIAQFQEKTNE